MSVVPKGPLGPAFPSRGPVLIRIIVLIVLVGSVFVMVASGIEPDVVLALLAGLAGLAVKLTALPAPSGE